MAAIASDIRFRVISGVGIFLIMLAICAAPPAKAAPVTITGTETRLEVNIIGFIALLNDGILITAIPPARIEYGARPAAIFPVTGGLYDVPNALAAITHSGGLHMEKASIGVAIDITNITLQCTGITGCRLIGTVNGAAPTEVAEVANVSVTDDEAGTITFYGRALVTTAGALALNTLFQTNVFVAGMELGELKAKYTYDATAPDAYVRPRTAPTTRTSLVPAYQECTAPDRVHGPPLDSSSCNPPVPILTERDGRLTGLEWAGGELGRLCALQGDRRQPDNAGRRSGRGDQGQRDRHPRAQPVRLHGRAAGAGNTAHHR